MAQPYEHDNRMHNPFCTDQEIKDGCHPDHDVALAEQAEPERSKPQGRMSQEEFEAEIASRYQAYVERTAEARALRELQLQRTDPRLRPTITQLELDIEQLRMLLTAAEPDVTALLVRIVHVASAGILVASEVRDGRG